MRLKDFMTTEIETISSTESAASAYQQMQQNHIHHLLVMDKNTVVGVITETSRGSGTSRDYISPEVLLAKEVMEDDLVIVESDTTVREAANLMRGRTIDCLPIVEDGRLVGIITTTDLLELLGRGSERIIADNEKRPVTREHPGRKQASFNPKLGKT